MALSRRQKLTITSLLLYWPAIFVLTHIPITVPLWAIQARISDKTLHYVAYFVLVFLLWFAISPNRKVNWRRAAAWWVLLVVVWYGAFDEWLQGYVGRSADVMDFFADLAGTLSALILLSILGFWPASLVVTAAAIFVSTKLTNANLADLMPAATATFHLFAHGFFSMLWIRYMHYSLPPKAPETKWLIGAFALPAGLLSALTLFSAVTGNNFRPRHIITSTMGIAIVVGTIYFTALFRRCLLQKLPPDDG